MRYILRNEAGEIDMNLRSSEIIDTVAYNFDLSKEDAERMIAQATKDEPLLLYSGEEVWTEE